jgi:hypothetical protein
MYTATFANQTGTQSHKHHLSLELELRIRHSTKPQPLPGYLCAPNLYTPGNHNFHSLGPLGRWYTTWVYTTQGLVLVSKKTMLYRTYVKLHSFM